MEIPVYIFTGFLEGGKTLFIQDTLEDKRFNSGERTLLLVCEEGEEEYRPERFSGKNVFIRTLEDESELNEQNLSRMITETKAERVLVEYNGMWLLQHFYDEMPDGWLPYQNMLFSKEKSLAVKPDAKVAYSTTNYHVFRSGLYARRVRMDAVGMGQPTRWWFWANATVRECVGLLTDNRRLQALILGSFLGISFGITWLSFQ